MNADDMKKVQRAFEKKPGYKTSTGYTGNRKTVRERKENKGKKKVLSNKQRQLQDLTRTQRRTFHNLQNELDQMFQKYSKVSRKEESKETKKDVKKGLKASGVWSIPTYKDYFKKSKSFLKYCVKEHGIQKFGDLKPGLVADFFEHHLNKGNSPKTISGYMSAIQKMCEFGVKDGIKRLNKLDTKGIRALIPEYDSANYKRGKNKNYKGYKVKDTQVLAKKAAEHFSPLHRAAIEVLGFGGPRIDEFRRIKWRNLDFENNRIYLTDDNMTKGNRPRYTIIKPETMALLKEIKDMNLHSNDDERIWGSKMSEQNVREFVKECARLGKKRYSAIHDFRRSAVRWHYKFIATELHHHRLDKEKLVDTVLEQVGVDERLNPMIEVKVPVPDKNGNYRYKTLKSGQRILDKKYFATKKDEFGNPVMKRKYIKEELMKRRIDYIVNLYLSQVLGHNRTDVTAIYEDKEEKRKVKEALNKKKK